MHLTKKYTAVIAILLVLFAANAALAIMYLNKDVAISGGVASTGSIALYKENGETTLTSIDFPVFTANPPHSHSQWFFINNTGNMPIVVYWDISNCIPNNWSKDLDGNAYVFSENGDSKFRFSINKTIVPDGSTGFWKPGLSSLNGLAIGVGQAAKLNIDLLHYVNVTMPGTFSFVLSFYAYDA